MRRTVVSALVATGLTMAMGGLVAPSASAANSGSPGDAEITLDLTDSGAGGQYEETFKRVYDGVAPSGTPVFLYMPAAYDIGTVPTGVRSMDPLTDWNPGDGATPCADKQTSDYVVTQEQIELLGDELADHILAVDEAHYRPVDLADPSDPNSDALVVVVYDLHDTGMYDCEETSYTAGYFAPEYIDEAGMNVMAIDAYDWANRIGDQTGNPDGHSELYEGVVAHEFEHLLHNYSDAGELSWVDEGLADFAIFLNGYDVGGSHLTYHQVFHRETSLTRWGGGLENYGAAYTFFQYVWEQAGGNGDGTFTADGEYDAAGGDLLIKKIFADPADGVEGVNNAIASFNAEGHPGRNTAMPSMESLFRDWAVAVYLDDEGSNRYDIQAVDFGDPASTTWTVDIANDVFWDERGTYQGALPQAKWDKLKNRPDPTALPFGTSYESFRNPGPSFKVDFSGDPVTAVEPHSGDLHWYAGYASQFDHVLGVDAGGAPTSVDFWTWYFIEEGFDYGFVEALVNGEWVTVPVTDDQGNEVSTDDDPFGNNEEGNGITGTSGGEYFVDEPAYIHLNADLPADATDVRFRYSTDAAYLDTGWFVDDVQVNGAPAAVTSESGWSETNGQQVNNWTVQVIASCDLTPGVDGPNEITDNQGTHVYQLNGAVIDQGGFSTKCANGKNKDVTVQISNLPSGDLTFLDADYSFRLVGQGNGQAKK